MHTMQCWWSEDESVLEMEEEEIMELAEFADFCDVSEKGKNGEGDSFKKFFSDYKEYDVSKKIKNLVNRATINPSSLGYYYRMAGSLFDGIPCEETEFLNPQEATSNAPKGDFYYIIINFHY